MSSNLSVASRSEIPEDLRWDLTKIFTDHDAWLEASEQVEKEIVEICKKVDFIDGDGLLSFLRELDRVNALLSRVFVYAQLSSDTDLADSSAQARLSRSKELSVRLSAAIAPFIPNLLAIEESKIEFWMENIEGLSLYRQKLEDTTRMRSHTRSSEVEKLLAEAGSIGGGAENLFSMFSFADLEYPPVENQEGKAEPLTDVNFNSKWLRSPDRGERSRAYETFFGTYKNWRNTLAANYDNQVKFNNFMASSRNHPSALSMKLSSINVPVSVYDNLIDTVHEKLSLLHRYLDLRRRLMGLSELKWYDLYLPLTSGPDFSIDFEAAKAKVLEVVSIYGDDYRAALESGFASRWIDVMPSQGKRGGAYSWGCQGTFPYMLLNWVGTIDSFFTLMHECGHSMHSFLTWQNQPPVYSAYTIFVAEVASTCNEALLAHHLLSETTDPAIRLYVINKQLESIRAVIYRQTMFAEFEKLAHEAQASGEALTADYLHASYLALNRKYYEPAVAIDDLIGYEFMRIPHFFDSFYVYQYATGMSAALSLSAQIIAEGEPAVKRYLEFLKSGSSRYSIDLLKDAGVDLTTPKPVENALGLFSGYLDQFEIALGELKS